MLLQCNYCYSDCTFHDWVCPKHLKPPGWSWFLYSLQIEFTSWQSKNARVQVVVKQMTMASYTYIGYNGELRFLGFRHNVWCISNSSIRFHTQIVTVTSSRFKVDNWGQTVTQDINKEITGVLVPLFTIWKSCKNINHYELIFCVCWYCI